MRVRATRTTPIRSRPRCAGTLSIQMSAGRWAAEGRKRSDRSGTTKACLPVCWNASRISETVVITPSGLQRADAAAPCEDAIPPMKLLIVGFAQAGHMGSYLASAARQLGLDFQIADAGDANARSRIGRSIYWHAHGKRPARLDQFG